MKQTADPAQIIQLIPQPAFLVKGGIVTEANEAAEKRQIRPGASVLELIRIGLEEYQNLSSGKLYLELTSGRTWVTIYGDHHLFCLDDAYTLPELRAFALAAQHLRQPLSNAITGTDLLMQNTALLEDSALKQQLGQINRSLHQLVRAVCNMSDVSQLGLTGSSRPEIRNISAAIDEIFEKATALTKESGYVLNFRGIQTNIDCAVDVPLLERAILNLISNAMKFSPSGSTIQARLKRNGNRLSLTVENPISGENRCTFSNEFMRFLREPGIEGGQSGIGLGLSVISNIASAHRGTILADTAQKNHARIVISLPITTNPDSVVRSPILIPGGYTGGIDSYLIELSDVLPSKFYEPV